MAITSSNITAGNATGQNPSTGSFTPTANALETFVIWSYPKAGQAAPTSVAQSGGLSLSMVTSVTGASGQVLSLWRGLTATPTGNPFVISHGADNWNVLWICDEHTGMDATGTNGSGAINQSKVANGGHIVTVTLDAAITSGNRGYGGFGGYSGSATPDYGAGMTGIQKLYVAGNLMGIESCYVGGTGTAVIGGTEANPLATSSPANSAAGIAIEIKLASAAAAGNPLIGPLTVRTPKVAA